MSFRAASEDIDDGKMNDVGKKLSVTGLKMKITRTKEPDEENLKMSKGKSTEKGYINKNNQKNNGVTSKEGTDNNQNRQAYKYIN